MKKKVFSFALAVIMLVSMFGVLPVEAASTPSFPIPKTVTYYAMKPTMMYLTVVEGVSKKSQIKNLKSSNSKVADVIVEKYKGDKYVCIGVRAVKPGKAKVSFTAKYGAGLKKSKKFSFTVLVKKYTNPCKAFMIGSKNYASRFKNSTFNGIKNPKKALKLNVKANSGWKLQDIYAMTAKGKIKYFKNGQKINTKTYTSVYASFMDKKTRDYLSVGINFY